MLASDHWGKDGEACEDGKEARRAGMIIAVEEPTLEVSRPKWSLPLKINSLPVAP